MRDEIEARLQGWSAGSGLEERISSQFEVIFTWMRTCSPPGADIRRSALATMDLYLWFLYPDDYAHADYAEVYHRLAMLVDGGPADEGRSALAGVTRLYRNHLDRIGALGPTMDRYRAERRTALSTYEQRNRDRDGGNTPDFETFVRVRDVTTLFRVWYSLWEVLSGVRLDDDEYARSPFATAIAAVTRWQVFINEIHSLERDCRDGMPNLIVCLERERAMSRETALEWVREEMRRLEMVVAQSRDAFESGAPSPRVAWAFDFLDTNLRGARTLYAHGLERYRSSARF